MKRNFLRIVLASSLTKLGDAVGSPKTTLVWLMNFAGAPPALVGLLVPIRESGSLIPQLVVAAWVRRMPVRKWAWVLGSVLQAGAMAGIGLSAWLLDGAAAGAAILGGLLVFSVARAACSVSSKDVLGKTIPKRSRGRVAGIATAVSGVLVVGVGLWLFAGRGANQNAAFYGSIVVAAGALWLLASVIYATIDEDAGPAERGDATAWSALRPIRLLRSDRDFRVFVIARSLLLGSALVAPYYVTLGRQASDGASWMLGSLVLANGLASSFSAAVWGRMADRSSRVVMALAGGAAGLLGLVVFACERMLGDLPWFFYPAAFLLLGVAHAGIRLGRKTYVVDMATGNRRTDYVALGNTTIGVLLLLLGGATASAGALPVEWIVLALSLLTLLGAATALRLREVQ